MKLKYVMLILFCFLIAENVYAGFIPEVIDWEVGGQWSSYMYMDAVQKGDVDDEWMSDNRLLFENDISWEERGVYAVMDMDWRYETFYGGLEDESQSDVRFRDVYAELRRENFNVAAGQKRVTWGKLDDLVVLDRVVPQDYTHFILYDKEERKDPALMLQHQWFLDEESQVETIFMPFFEPSDLDFFGTNWAVFGHLKESISASSDYTAAQKASASGITIQEDDEVTDESLKNSQAAFRYRGRKAEVDYGIYYMNLYHSLPVLKETTAAGNETKRFLYEPTVANLDALAGASADDLLLTEEHPRINTVGADWETVLGAIGLRGEMALFLGMPYLEDNFAYTEKDQISVGVGIDHTTDSHWYFDVQYLQDYIMNYQGLYGTEESPYRFAGTISKDFMRGIIQADLDWVWNASYGDWMVNPEVTYAWQDSGMHVSTGVFVFQDGTSRTLFGRYDNNDTIYIKIGIEF